MKYKYEEEVRSYAVTDIDWDITEEDLEQFGDPDLPSEVDAFEVKGNAHWKEHEWADKLVDTLSDLFCWTINSCIYHRIK